MTLYKPYLSLRCRFYCRSFWTKSSHPPVLLTRRIIGPRKPEMSIFKTIKSAVITSSGLGSPAYTEVKKQDDVEERRYAPAKWVSTCVQGMEHDKSQREGFQRLFKYITGNNKSDTKVEMTAPVVTRVNPGAGPNCENSFTVSFYIPTEHQESPPEPSDPNVFVEEWPERTLLCQGFGGFAKEDAWLGQAKKLAESVEARGDKVQQNVWFTAAYNSPFQLFGRTNEVWFVKE